MVTGSPRSHQYDQSDGQCQRRRLRTCTGAPCAGATARSPGKHMCASPDPRAAGSGSIWSSSWFSWAPERSIEAKETRGGTSCPTSSSLLPDQASRQCDKPTGAQAGQRVKPAAAPFSLRKYKASHRPRATDERTRDYYLLLTANLSATYRVPRNLNYLSLSYYTVLAGPSHLPGPAHGRPSHPWTNERNLGKSCCDKREGVGASE